MNIVILGTLWQTTRLFGRFAVPRANRSFTPWWTTACRWALTRFRAARGTTGHQAARKHLRKAKQHHWQRFVSTCDRSVGSAEVINPKLHRVVKQGIRLKTRSSETVRMAGKVLSDAMACKVWPAFLESQVSWQGPKSAAE